MMTPQQFSQQIKAKYPQYQSVDDNTLAQQVIAKYPQYKSQVDFGQPQQQSQGGFQGFMQGVEQNPIMKFLIGKSMNIAQDVGSAMGMQSQPGVQKSQTDAMNMADQVMKKAATVKDPNEKKRLLKIAGLTYQTNRQNAQQEAGSFSPDIKQNYLQRAGEAGIQTGLTLSMTPGGGYAIPEEAIAKQFSSKLISAMPDMTGNITEKTLPWLIKQGVRAGSGGLQGLLTSLSQGDNKKETINNMAANAVLNTLLPGFGDMLATGIGGLMGKGGSALPRLVDASGSWIAGSKQKIADNLYKWTQPIRQEFDTLISTATKQIDAGDFLKLLGKEPSSLPSDFAETSSLVTGSATTRGEPGALGRYTTEGGSIEGAGKRAKVTSGTMKYQEPIKQQKIEGAIEKPSVMPSKQHMGEMGKTANPLSDLIKTAKLSQGESKAAGDYINKSILPKFNGVVKLYLVKEEGLTSQEADRAIASGDFALPAKVWQSFIKEIIPETNFTKDAKDLSTEEKIANAIYHQATAKMISGTSDPKRATELQGLKQSAVILEGTLEHSSGFKHWIQQMAPVYALQLPLDFIAGKSMMFPVSAIASSAILSPTAQSNLINLIKNPALAGARQGATRAVSHSTKDVIGKVLGL